MKRRVVYSTANKLVGFVTEDLLKERLKITLTKNGRVKLFEIEEVKKLSSSLVQIKNSNITMVLEDLI